MSHPTTFSTFAFELFHFRVVRALAGLRSGVSSSVVPMLSLVDAGFWIATFVGLYGSTTVSLSVAFFLFRSETRRVGQEC